GRAMGRAGAAEAAGAARLPAACVRRRCDLAMVGQEMVSRGSRVSGVFSGHAFSGLVVGAGPDHVTVQGAGQIADSRIDAGFWSILAGADEGGVNVAGEDTLTARLAAAADRGGMVRLALAGGEIVIGRVDVVESDHVELVDADDRTLYVPAGLILAIVRSSESQ